MLIIFQALVLREKNWKLKKNPIQLYYLHYLSHFKPCAQETVGKKGPLRHRSVTSHRKPEILEFFFLFGVHTVTSWTTGLKSYEKQIWLRFVEIHQDTR